MKLKTNLALFNIEIWKMSCLAMKLDIISFQMQEGE